MSAQSIYEIASSLILELHTLWIGLAEEEAGLDARATLLQIQQECQKLKWGSLSAQTDGIIRQIEAGAEPETVKALTDVLIRTLQHELVSSRFFVISAAAANLFYSQTPFGLEVSKNFPIFRVV